jgi:phospholipid-binding lipoprotein MlaA
MLSRLIFISLMCCNLLGCLHHCPHPDDPFEPINREIFKMNMAFDATVLQPPARMYVLVIPAPMRAAINNIYVNISTLPTIANDILQLQYQHTIQDVGRFILNSTLGLGGIGDVATELHIPSHHNDFGLTLAHWGNLNSPYIMIPFLGPSTLRDGMSLLVDYTFFSPYPFIADPILYNLLGLRYVDLRSQMFDNIKLVNEAIDPYKMMKDGYLQYRQHLIEQNHSIGKNPNEDSSASLYIEEDST